VPFDPEHSLSDQQRTATSSAVTGASGCGAQTYQCPEERSPVSQAVHLGRLASGWSACRDCVWKDDVGDAVRLTATARAETEKHRGIRRTEFGVRGTYLNTIDRFRSAQLATIFSTQIVHQTTTTDIDGLSEDDDADVVSTTAKAAVAIGYDGRLGSPDLFAGVNSAVRQNGCNVVDAGRCTAASLLNVFRMNPGVRGAILVTGAGGSAGDVGMDVFTQDQQPVPVPWQKYGVINRACHTDRRHKPLASIEDVLAQFRSGHQNHIPDTTDAVQFEESELVLPDLTGGGQHLFRSVRHSGSLTSVQSEDEYRLWQQRWWPNASGVAVTAVVADSVVADRLQRLASDRLLNIQLHTAPAALTPRDTALPEGGRTTAVRFEIGEDDRFVRIASRNNGFYSAEKIAAWINRATHSGNSHVTAHATADSTRILLVDLALPNSGRQQELISDGLAVAGLVTSLLSSGKNRLPV
jgi:hypothetical protein